MRKTFNDLDSKDSKNGFKIMLEIFRKNCFLVYHIDYPNPPYHLTATIDLSFDNSIYYVTMGMIISIK